MPETEIPNSSGSENMPVWDTALDKACQDPFFYEAAFSNGMVICFVEAEIPALGWVRFKDIRGCVEIRSYTGPEMWIKRPDAELWPRGLDVQLQHIVWIADAPIGS